MNAVIESGRAVARSVHAPRLRVFQWLVRREWWENRSIWIAPLVVACITLAGVVFGQVNVGDLQVGPSDATSAQAARAAELTLAAPGWARATLLALGIPFYFVLLFTQFFYALYALYEDRKDRSVLFWKSLPTSDLETVLSKLFVAAVLMPLVVAGVVLLTQVLFAVVATFRVDAVAAELSRALGPQAGDAAHAFVRALANPQVWLELVPRLLLLVGAFAFWTLPIVGFALLVSAAAPRSPTLLALLLPAGIGLAESLLFGSNWLGERINAHAFGAIVGSGAEAVMKTPGMPTGLGSVARHFSGQMTDLTLWSGVVVGIAFIAGAVWARRYRDENT